MLAFIFEYWIINKYASKRGRISPAWGFSSAFSLVVLVNIFMLVIFQMYPETFTKSGLFSDSPNEIDIKKLQLTSVAVALIFNTLLFIIILKLKKKIDYRNSIKKTFINYRFVGWVVIVLTIIMTLVSLASGNSRDVAVFLGSGLFLIAVVVTNCFKFHRQSRSLSLTQKLSNDKRSPVLLLRSFDDAKKRAKLDKTNLKYINNSSFLENKLHGYTLDELLTDSIEKNIGPLVSLGDPNDYLPALGSAKLYIPDSITNKEDVWWDAAKELIEKAQLIIVLESKGDNIYRELEYIHENINPEKVTFLTYPDFFETDDSLWYEFKTLCERLDIELPMIHIGKSKVVTFGANWDAQISTELNKTPDDIASTLTSQLQDANK